MKKSVSAPRTARKALRNGSSRTEARQLAERFHGREVESIVNVLENYSEPRNLAELGTLVELVVNPTNSRYEYPINFEGQNEEDVKYQIRVCSDPKGQQIYFVGGSQDISSVIKTINEDRDSMLNLEHKQFIILGNCVSIAYFTDKHHLVGPKSQRYGTCYEHQFGEDNGVTPILAYDKRNKRLMLLGGSYTVEDRGIIN